MSAHKEIVRSAWGITFWTFLSRITGLLRDTTIARLLGASAESDAYLAAFRIPNTFRAIVGEGGLPGAVVPIAKRVERERRGEEGLYAGRVLVLLGAVVFALVVFGIAFAPFVVRLFAGGFQKSPGKFELAVTLTRLMFPYILLVSSAALLESFLNAKGRFQLSAATPIALNLAIVAAAYALSPAGLAVPLALAVGVLFGGFLQLAMQVPTARASGLRFGGSLAEALRAVRRDRDVRETVLKIAPRLYGTGISQVNFLISSRTLAAIGNAVYTYNYNAFRIVDLFLGGFVVSVTRAILPSLSEHALDADRGPYLATVRFGLRMTAFVTLPATVGLMLAAHPVIDVVFRRGLFDPAAVDETALSLFWFAPGLFAAAAVKILTQAFYALGDTKTPVLVATFDLVAFTALCFSLAGPFGHAGVAMATTAGFWINSLGLLVLLWRRLGTLGARELSLSAGRLGFAALGMAAALWGAETLLPYRVGWGLGLRLTWLFGAVGLSAAVFLGAAKALGAPEVSEVLGIFRRKKRASC